MRYWPQKPPLGVPVNWGDPLAQGLVGCWLMNEGGGTIVNDLSGNGNTGTLVADTHTVAGKFGPALSFDGTDDYVTIPSINYAGVSQLTVSFWVKFNAAPTATIYMLQQGNSANNRVFNFLVLDGGRTHFTLWNSSAASETGRYDSIITTTNWYHIVGTYDGANVRVYVNGILGTYRQGALTGTLEDAVSGGLDQFILGGSLSLAGVLSSDFAGQIDNVSIYNRALSASEIAQLYMTPFRIFQESF